MTLWKWRNEVAECCCRHNMNEYYKEHKTGIYQDNNEFKFISQQGHNVTVSIPSTGLRSIYIIILTAAMLSAPPMPPGQMTASYSEDMASFKLLSGTMTIFLLHTTGSLPVSPATVTSTCYKLKLKLRKLWYPAMHTNYSLSDCTIFTRKIKIDQIIPERLHRCTVCRERWPGLGDACQSGKMATLLI